MTLRFANLPAGLRETLPADFTPAEGAEYVVFDRKAFEAFGAPLRLVEAYSRALGSELIATPVEELPENLKAAGQMLAGSNPSFTGQALLDALSSPNAVDPALRAALPDLAEIVRERMGKEELLKGTLSKGLPDRRVNERELGSWFAAAVADVRATAGTNPVGKEGADRLIKLSKQVLLNFGAGLITRAFFDDAVRDLNASPGLTPEAVEGLAKFRSLTQPGRSSHVRNDKGALVSIDLARRREAEHALLNETQKKAVNGVTDRAKPMIEQARKNLIAAIAPWGFSEADLDRVITYIQRYARITIQFHPDKQIAGGKAVVDCFGEDPHYKNQFQTQISSGSHGPYAGSSRDGWEKNIFDGAYHDHPLIPEERPKYGGLSALNSPKGNGGDWYGLCFFELRQDVKFRTTFTPRNSSGCNKTQVSTIDTLEVLLDQVRQNDPSYLKEIFEVAQGKKVSVSKSYNASYIEAQIHGEIDLARDVDFVVIHSKYLTTPYGQKLLQLAEKIGATPKFTDHAKFYMSET